MNRLFHLPLAASVLLLAACAAAPAPSPTSDQYRAMIRADSEVAQAVGTVDSVERLGDEQSRKKNALKFWNPTQNEERVLYRVKGDRGERTVEAVTYTDSKTQITTLKVMP